MRVTKAKDREALAQRVEALADELGVEHTRPANLGRRVLCVDFLTPEGLGCCVQFDGSSRVFECVIPWNVRTTDRAGKRLTDAFGCDMAASVNPHHRQKCTCIAPDFDSVLWKLRRGFEMSKDGTAWEKL